MIKGLRSLFAGGSQKVSKQHSAPSSSKPQTETPKETSVQDKVTLQEQKAAEARKSGSFLSLSSVVAGTVAFGATLIGGPVGTAIAGAALAGGVAGLAGAALAKGKELFHRHKASRLKEEQLPLKERSELAEAKARRSDENSTKFMGATLATGGMAMMGLALGGAAAAAAVPIFAGAMTIFAGAGIASSVSTLVQRNKAEKLNRQAQEQEQKVPPEPQLISNKTNGTLAMV